MFVRLTASLLTLVAFIVHAVWGCCAHHAHVSELQSANNAVHSHAIATVDHADGHSRCSHMATHDHQCPIEEQPCENHDHPQQDCDEESCSFVNVSKVKIPASTIAAAIEMVATVDSTLSFLQAANRTALDDPFGARSTGRVRPLLQTWLL